MVIRVLVVVTVTLTGIIKMIECKSAQEIVDIMKGENLDVLEISFTREPYRHAGFIKMFESSFSVTVKHFNVEETATYKYTWNDATYCEYDMMKIMDEYSKRNKYINEYKGGCY